MFYNKNQSLDIVGENQYKKLFELSHDAIFIIELKTEKIIDANLSAVKIYGYSKNEFLQMKFNELSIDRSNKLNFSEGSSNIIPNYIHKKKDGRLFQVELKLIDIKTDENKLNFLIVKDLAKRDDVENNFWKNEADFSYLFEKNARPMLIYDTNSLKILSVNDAAVEKYGYSKKEFENILIQDLRPEEEQKSFFEIANRIDKQVSVIYETKHKLKDNKVIFVEINSNKIKYNGIDARLIEVIDITAHKMYEKELILANEKAQEMNRIKNIFFTNMSHELRTPLSGILGFSELLLEEIGNAEHKNMINAIFFNGHRLLETLNKILHISKLESERLHINLEVINIVDFINKIIHKCEKNLIAKNLFLKFSPNNSNLMLNTDPEFLTTILENLINNAIKFTNNGGVLVNCYKNFEEDQEFIVIEVSDTGIGIPPNSLKIIFEEFRQASEGLSRNYEGMGLGLAIAKRYTELLGGKITVESTPGAGSTFRLEFPVCDLSYFPNSNNNFNNIENDSEKNPISEKSLVLLVEDDLINTNMIKRFLQHLCTLHTVTNGEEALQLVKQNQYDAILMDIGLGKGMNGIEATKIIRTIPEYKEVPIIAITAYAMNGDKEKFLSSGMTGYLSKPFQMNDLVSVLGKALKLN